MQPPEPIIKETNWSKDLEKQLLAKWEKERKPFVPGSKNFTIDTPPPYPSLF